VAWLVAAGGVEGELAEKLAGVGVDDADVAVLGEDEDAGSGVGSADADGAQAPVVAEGDLAAGVDAVAADSVVGVAVPPGARGGGDGGDGWGEPAGRATGL
jgi:hypothetical protein